MEFKCRLCGKSCEAAQGRGAHESHCAREKGAQLFGSGPDRHFIMNGKRIDAPNSKNTTPAASTQQPPKPAKKPNPGAANTREKAEQKALELAMLVGNEPMEVRDIHKLYCKLVGKTNLSRSSVSGFLRLHPQTFKSVSFGVYQVIQHDEQARSPKSEIIKATPQEHPSEIESDNVLSPEQIFAQESALSHGAVSTIQKTAALLQFATLMEDIGPSSALAMIAGMSKIGKALNGRR